MRYFLEPISEYIEEQIIQYSLKKDINDAFIYPYGTIFDNRVFINYIPSDNYSYISLGQIGETKNEYNKEIINVSIKIDYKNTDNISYKVAFYLCKGIRDICLDSIGKYFDSFYISNIIDLGGINVSFSERDSFYCELLIRFEVDEATFPDGKVTIY